MNTEVQASNQNVPATQTQSAPEQILKSDIVLPKVLLQQALSDFVKTKKAHAGDLCRSSNGELLGGEDKPLEFIPLTFQNLWMMSEDEKGKGNKADFKFRGYEPRTASNESADWEFMRDGTKWKRTKTMNVYALLVRDLEKMTAAMEKFQKDGEIPDLDSAMLPVVIQFRNTSFKAAKDVATLFVKAADIASQMGVDVPVYGRTMRLEVTAENNGEHDYYVLNAKEAGPTKKEYLAQCARWRATLINMGGSAKIDDTDVAGAETTPF